MSQHLILLLTAFLYAGYNIFIKISGNHVPAGSESIILAIIALQFAALTTSTIYALYSVSTGVTLSGLPLQTFFWAVVAGICIAGAEICYLYLFGIGGADGQKLSANVVVPFVVGGTIVIATLVSAFVFHERFGAPQIIGTALAITGISLLFVDGSTFAKWLKM